MLCFFTLRQDLQGFLDQLGSFLKVAHSLDEAGNGNIFRHSLGFVIKSFVREGEA